MHGIPPQPTFPIGFLHVNMHICQYTYYPRKDYSDSISGATDDGSKVARARQFLEKSCNGFLHKNKYLLQGPGGQRSVPNRTLECSTLSGGLSKMGGFHHVHMDTLFSANHFWREFRQF